VRVSADRAGLSTLFVGAQQEILTHRIAGRNQTHNDRAGGWRRLPSRPPVAAAVVAGVLSLVWALWLAHDAGDLAAQYAWTDFVRQHPGLAYNLSWYGGIHPASYSVISPYLMAFAGVRTTGVLAATGTAALGAVLLTRSGIRWPLALSLWWSFAVWCNIASGRVTYLLGMLFALLATVLLVDNTGQRRPRPVLAALLGVVATMASPVAGLFVEVLAGALFLTGRRRHAYLLAPGPPLVIAATSLLFPFAGIQPFDWRSALPTLAAALAVAVFAPTRWRTIRAGALVYAAGVVLCWALPTPVGSNVERLSLLAGAALLICAASAGRRRGWTMVGAWTAAAAITAWTIQQPVADLINTAPGAAVAANAQPLIAELQHLHAEQGRVEVVPLRSHWEAAGIAPYVNLARGWNRQADVARNPLFYDGTLTPASYRSWLEGWSVGFVVLPTDEPDGAGVAEAKIITAGYPWLHLVWTDNYWRVFRFDGADPLAAPPASVTYAGAAALTVTMPEAGAVLVRVAWSPWLGIQGVREEAGVPHACLLQNGEWTELVTPAPGTFTIEARYSLDRGTPCATPSPTRSTGRPSG
jgi:hypothetical protein